MDLGRCAICNQKKIKLFCNIWINYCFDLAFLHPADARINANAAMHFAHCCFDMLRILQGHWWANVSKLVTSEVFSIHSEPFWRFFGVLVFWGGAHNTSKTCCRAYRGTPSRWTLVQHLRGTQLPRAGKLGSWQLAEVGWQQHQAAQRPLGHKSSTLDLPYASLRCYSAASII